MRKKFQNYFFILKSKSFHSLSLEVINNNNNNNNNNNSNNSNNNNNNNNNTNNKYYNLILNIKAIILQIALFTFL